MSTIKSSARFSKACFSRSTLTPWGIFKLADALKSASPDIGAGVHSEVNFSKFIAKSVTVFEISRIIPGLSFPIRRTSTI